MKLTISILSSIAVACATTTYEYGKVHSLSADNFSNALNLTSLSMVKFYSPSCGPCRVLEPHYEEAAKQLSARNVTLFKVNCVEHPDLCQSQEIRGYPTLKSFYGIEPYEDFNSHDTAMIVDYMTRLSLPPLQKLDKVDDLKSLISDNEDVKFLGLFKNTDTDEFTLFKNFAHKNRSKALFLTASNEDIFKHLEVQGDKAIVCLKSFDDKKAIMQEAITEDSLYQFVHVELLPLLGDINHNNYFQYADANLPIVFIFYVKQEDKEKLAKDLKRIAEKYKGKYSFAFIEGFQFDEHAESLGLKTSSFPAVAVQDFKQSLKYPMPNQGSVTAKDLDEFIAGINKGTIKPFFISAAAPENNNGPVKVIVHSNFHELIMDDSKDALVEMYTNQCSACKRFAPAFEQLGESYMLNNSTFLVGKMDLENNDPPAGVSLNIETIPALFLFPAKSKNEPIKYNGDFTLGSIKAFIADHSSMKPQPIVIEEPIMEPSEEVVEEYEEEHLEL